MDGTFNLTEAQKAIYNSEEVMDINTSITTDLWFDGTVNFNAGYEAALSLYRSTQSLRTSIAVDAGGNYTQNFDEVPTAVRHIFQKAFSCWDEYQGWASNYATESLSHCLFEIGILSIPGKYGFIIKCDHLISDGMSQIILLARIKYFYDRAIDGRDTISFASDYTTHIANELKYYGGSKQYIRDIAYWKSVLGEIEENTVLGKSIATTLADFKTMRYIVDIGETKDRQLANLCSKYDITEVSLLLSVFLYAVAKFFSMKDVITYFAFANRWGRGERSIPGMFANMLPFLSKGTGENEDCTVLDFSRKNSAHLFELIKHSRLDESKIDQMASEDFHIHGKLSEIAFSYQNTGEFNYKEYFDERFESHWYSANSQFEALVFHARRHPQENLCFFVDYRLDKLDADTVSRFLSKFVYFLEQVLANPEIKLSELELLSKEEKARILNEFNATDSEYPHNKTVIDFFEEQAAKVPLNTAVVYENATLTYAALNRKANQLARTLRELGVKPDDCVGLVVERSLEMIIAILGTLKAGGAYVPIDPEYPAERIKYTLEDCNAKVLLIYGVKAPDGVFIPILDLGMESSYAKVSTNLARISNLHDLAYVIYTSGTTGRPKGVMIEHNSLTSYVINFNDNFAVTEKDVILQQAFIGFDTSVEEIYPPLTTGGKIVIVDFKKSNGLQDIVRAMSSNSVSIVSVSPLLLGELATFNTCDTLRLAISGGDILRKENYESLNDNVVVYNTYGPTEATVCATYYKVDRANPLIPIGKPIKNKKVYILDGNRLCGIGVPGELCITGDGVARGYLNQPELTAQKFVKNPFGEGTMYRSGDLAKWLPDGNIEYLGRIDEQVKIRGFRVELGEIETVIRSYPDIHDVAAVVKEVRGDKHICAYVVSDKEIDFQSLRTTLHEKLPAYMVPTYMMRIEGLPLTRNGKLDKRALPEPEITSGREYTPPKTELEKAIAEVFGRVLGVERVGTDDNFFEMGGHSLRATVAINAIEQSTGVKISLRNFFANPTVSQLAKSVAENGSHLYQPIPKAREQDCYPMSSAQKRLYVIEQMEEQGTAYNMPAAIKINGNIDVDKIRSVLQELVNRHETLRTSFAMKDGEAVQIIHTSVTIKVEYVERKAYSPQEALDFVKPFNLAQAPLLRVKLIHLRDEDAHVMLFDMHHIISDGMTMTVFIREFSQLYEGAKIQPLRVQYKDYSEWLRTRDISAQKRFWLGEFSDTIPVLDMPLDYARPKIQSYRGTYVRYEIDCDLREKVNSVNRKYGTTSFMTLLAAFSVLLHKYSRQDDIVIGTPVSGRTHRDTESMLGMFVNTLALRTRPSAEKTFAAFLGEVKKLALDAFENQEYPFEELIENVSVERDPSRNPLFDVMFVMQNNEDVSLRLGEATLKLIPVETAAVKFDLTVEVSETQNGFSLGLEYCTDLFTEESVNYLLRHYDELLRKVTENPEMRLKDLEFATDEEKSKILGEFNNTDADYPREKTIVDLFEEQAARVPGYVAAVYEGQKLTYAELNERSNRLAVTLRGLGVKPDDRVGLLAERGLEMIVGILGTLKAGGAYVPVDPEYPADRIRYTLADSAVTALLICGTKAPEGIDAPVLDLRDEASYSGDGGNLVHVNKPDDLAYIIYTSGTTGRPKGVMIEHRGVVNFREYFLNNYHPDENITVLQFTNITFDPHVAELSLSIFSGAKLYICPREIRNSIADVRNLIKREKISAVLLTPTYLRELGSLDARIIISGGAEADKESLRLLIPTSVYSNDYGPTEATVCTTHWLYNPAMDIPERIPIGKPIENKKVYILDADKLCGIGVPGELCIAGVGLARGYLNQPALTAEKFVHNLFGEGRMYRSGDLARWLPDGNIEYLGRIDEQVKIRGFRVELGEIESVIRAQEYVRDVAVVAKEVNGDKSICAYIVSNGMADFGSVREALREKLPNYMIPSYMMEIERLPLTTNGKLDKRSLPQPEAVSERAYVAPKTESEKIIAKVFEKVLNVRRIGVDDNFFEMGGHSLRATVAVNAIEQSTGVKISLRNFFANPTVSQLAKSVAESGSHLYQPIPKAREQDCYPMSSAQKRLYVIEQMEEQGTAYNMPAAIKINGNIDVDKIRSVLQELVDRHETLRTSFAMKDGEAVQIIHTSVTIKVEYVERKAYSPQEALDFVKPFNLAQAPLLRVKLIHLRDEDAHVMLFDMHHIISDGMTMTVFIREFSQLYEGAKIQPLRVQYKDYSEWLRTRDISAQKRFWLSEFSDTIPVLDMPLDYARPKIQSYQGSDVQYELDSTLRSKIEKINQEYGVTSFMTMLAAFSALLHKYSRQDDIVIGTPVSGRTHRDTENMLGVFVNTLAMRTFPSAEKPFSEFLQEVKTLALNAYENQEYPFEELVEEAGIVREPSRNPLFDVMFVMQNNEEVSLRMGDATLTMLPLANTIAKFDMTLEVKESENGLALNLEYCSNLFTEESVRNVLRHYERLLEEITANPDVKLGELELVTEEEKSQILDEFNNTDAEYPHEKTIIDVFEEQAARVPFHTAIVYEDESLTYAALNQKTNQLARTLRTLGVKPNDSVGLVVERSLEMIIAILGTLKAGGVYVPIDPEYPADRIKYTLEDCGAKAVLVYGAKAPEGIVAPILNLSAESSYAKDDTNLVHVNKPCDLAYIIYTSGTTGRPKGTLIEHKNIVSLFMNNHFEFDFNEHDTWTMFHSYCFDFSVWEMYGALLYGGKIIVISKDTAKNPQKFAEIITHQSVTVLNQVPSSFNNLLDTDNCKFLENLRYLIIGGEALVIDRIKPLRVNYPKLNIINIYGPTETTVYATDWPYFYGNNHVEKAPIGRPIANKKVYILDSTHLCGIGVPGELCIAGIGVARGYLNRPELTKDKFVLNPYGNGYLYRSGDLARWLPDGNIDFLGRIDEQIKIRGFRVELDEIQSVILSVANIQDVAVIVKEINGGKVICAYIVANGDIDVQSVEDALRHKLPDYMIPASITQIKSLPITRNGKLDKRALPEPEFISSTDYVAPRTHIEEALVEVFEDVLGIKHIGITDDFFRMGGDSIKVIRVVTKMRDKDYDVSVIDIMQYREIRRIANHVKAVSHVTGTEYAEKSGNIDTSISDVLTPDYTDILRKSVLEYTTDYPQDAPLLRYAPLQMQKYMLLNKASVITDTFYLDMPYSAVCTLLNSIIASQGALRTRYDVNAGYLEELQFSSKSIPLIPIGPHDDFEQIIKSYKEMIHKFDFFCQNRLLSTFVVVQKGENSTCVLFSAQHAVWDAMSSSILTSYIYHLKDTSSVSLQNISYARYCSKYSGSMDSYVLTKTETRILDRMTKLSQRAFRSADLHSEKDYHPVSFINLPLNHEVCAQFQSYPIEAAILIIHSLLHDDGNNKHEMYAIMRHNRRDENQSLLGLVLDMDICVYDVANNRMTAFKNRSALPFTEKVRLYVERNRVDFLPTIPFINYTGMYERHDLMLSDGVRNVRIPITSQERSYHGTSMEYTFNNDVFAGGVFGKSVSEEEIWKAIEYAKERLKTLKWVETDVT